MAKNNENENKKLDAEVEGTNVKVDVTEGEKQEKKPEEKPAEEPKKEKKKVKVPKWIKAALMILGGAGAITGAGAAGYAIGKNHGQKMIPPTAPRLDEPKTDIPAQPQTTEIPETVEDTFSTF